MKTSMKPVLLSTMILVIALSNCTQKSQQLPWDREIPLRETARSVFYTNTLNPTDPSPDWNCYPLGSAMSINNLKMRTTLWGSTDRVTISLTKNNVWDRRVNPRGLEAPTLQEIIDGA